MTQMFLFSDAGRYLNKKAAFHSHPSEQLQKASTAQISSIVLSLEFSWELFDNAFCQNIRKMNHMDLVFVGCCNTPLSNRIERVQGRFP